MKASSQKRGIWQQHCKEHREAFEKKVREAMAEKPGISLNGLREKVGGGNGTLGTIYNRVRREIAEKNTGVL